MAAGPGARFGSGELGDFDSVGVEVGSYLLASVVPALGVLLVPLPVGAGVDQGAVVGACGGAAGGWLSACGAPFALRLAGAAPPGDEPAGCRAGGLVVFLAFG